MSVAVSGRVDGEDNGVGASLLAAVDLLLGNSVVGGQVKLANVRTSNRVRVL